jgi:hypothetical protein
VIDQRNSRPGGRRGKKEDEQPSSEAIETKHHVIPSAASNEFQAIGDSAIETINNADDWNVTPE